jgi:hypothetical protein
MTKCVIFIIVKMKWIEMNNYIILEKKKHIKDINQVIKRLNLTNTLKNKRTSLWENDDIEISIDKKIIRILIYSKNDIQHYTNFILQR